MAYAACRAGTAAVFRRGRIGLLEVGLAGSSTPIVASLSTITNFVGPEKSSSPSSSSSSSDSGASVEVEPLPRFRGEDDGVRSAPALGLTRSRSGDEYGDENTSASVSFADRNICGCVRAFAVDNEGDADAPGFVGEGYGVGVMEGKIR